MSDVNNQQNSVQNEQPFVSVIVPVYNDPQRIKQCIEALLRQTYPRDRYEIVVVDNASTDTTPAVIRQYPVTLLVEDQIAGSYAARNKGLAEARGTIIAFTDSDCTPAPNWIEQGVARLRGTANCGLVAGKIEVFCVNPAKPTAVELYESITAFPQAKFIEKYHYGATANVFTYRAVIDRVGSFNAMLKSGGDREWGQRVFAAGYIQVYEPTAIVAHPARSSFSEIRAKQIRVNTGLNQLQDKRKGATRKFIKRVLKDLVPPWKDIIAAGKDVRLQGVQQKTKFILTLLYLRYMQAWVRIQMRFGWTRSVR